MRSLSHGAAYAVLVLAIAVVVPPVAGAAASTEIETAAAKRLVVAPKSGRVVRANKVRVRVRVPDVATLRARLNGAAVGGDFGRARRGVRTLHASISHGLKRGPNVLRVRVTRPGREGRRTVVRFRVDRPRELVGAGRDRTIVLGGRWKLSGRVLKAPGGQTRPAARWRVVSAPRKSWARVVRRPAGRVRAAQASPALLTAPAALRPAFRPDLPGRYTLRLTAGGTTDVVKIDAVPEQLMVPLDTMAGPDSDQGIRIGPTVYPLSKATGTGPLQLLVLTRAHLEFVSNTRYPGADKLGAALGGLGADKLAIVAWQWGDTIDGQLGLDAALAQIGWPKLGDLANSPGTISAIGVNGMKRGDADVKLNQPRPTDDNRSGRIQGYLSPDQNRAYGFVPSQRVPFEYGPTTPLPAGTPSTCGAVCAGLIVQVQDRYTLATRSVQFYSLGNPSDTRDQHTAEALRMVNDFKGPQPPGALITIRAVSNAQSGPAWIPPIGAIDRAALRQISDLVVDAGGTRDGFNSIALKGGETPSRGRTYTLVGWKGAGEDAGAEVAAGTNGASAAPVIKGVLRPDRQMRMRPANVRENDGVTDRLSTVMLEPPTTGWPLDGDAGAQAALSWLGGQDNRLGANPRTAYWRQDFAAVGTWLDIRDAIKAVAFEDGHGFTKDDFAKAQAQLVKELGLVFKVRSYVTQLSTVFKDANGVAWARTHTVADDVFKAVNPPDEETTLSWLEFTKILLDIAGPFTHEASAEVANLLDLAMWLYGAGEKGAPTYDEFAIEADQLGAELEDLAKGSGKAAARMGDVIVNDYAKLQLVGANALCNPGAGCPEGWSFTGDDATTAAADMDRAIQRIAYETFVPMGYPAFRLARSGDFGTIPSVTFSAPPKDLTGYLTVHGRPEWPAAPAQAYTSLLTDVDPAGADNWYTTSILHTESLHGVIQDGYPPAAMLDHMFKPVPDTNDPDDDGLGMSLPDMVRTADFIWFHGSEADENYWTRWIH